MCGLVGFTNTIDEPKPVLLAMMDKIIHRGPDSAGEYIDDKIAMGFRRLSIIDLEGSDQPLFNEDNTMVLTFNGEIYNYKILREELLSLGHTFRTKADSEVLLHAYESWGTGFLNRLRGMFSFVIWDKTRGRLFGTRDYFGIKPMYYAHMGDTFLYGSEIKSFLLHPHFQKTLNHAVLEQYLSFQYSPTQETFFRNVYKLPPAHYFTYENGRMEITRYWEPKFDAKDDKTPDEWAAEIDDYFHDSVQAHKISDVEVSSFLSSGVDSSYIACIADVDKTFTVGFQPAGIADEKQYNEISHAQEFAKQIHVKNINKVITADEYWENLPEIQYHMDEPLADPSAVALYFVCGLAAGYVKAVLSGEGADEVFGGYNIYKEPLEFQWYDKIPLFLRRIIGAAAERLPAKSGLNFLVRRSRPLEKRFIGNACIFTKKQRDMLLKNPTGQPDPSEICKPVYDRVKDKDKVTKMQYLDLHLWMAGDILLKADKMSMANSLELRVPFLDKEIMKLAGQIPLRYRVNEENTKYVMRKAALRSMPEKIANKKKLGFPVPIRVWLKEEKYFNRIKEDFTSSAAAQYFHTDRLVRLLEEHRAGKYDHSRKIWTVYTFLVWYRVFFEAPGSS